MQLKPDLGLYRRALVNLLIACNADIRVHNCSEFAEECLELLEQLQRDGYPPNEGTLLIEKHARETLIAIEMEEAELKRVEGQVTEQGGMPSSTLEKLKLGERSDTEDPMEMDAGDDQEVPRLPAPRAKSSSILPGMYTDHYGQQEKAKRVEKAGKCIISMQEDVDVVLLVARSW